MCGAQRPSCLDLLADLAQSGHQLGKGLRQERRLERNDLALDQLADRGQDVCMRSGIEKSMRSLAPGRSVRLACTTYLTTLPRTCCQAEVASRFGEHLRQLRRTGRSRGRLRARGRLIASASRRTIALPTIRPSATGASWRTWSGPLIPKPMQIGKSVWVRSQRDRFDQIGGKALPLAGDPRDRDIIDEPRGRAGDLERPARGASWA